MLFSTINSHTFT